MGWGSGCIKGEHLSEGLLRCPRPPVLPHTLILHTQSLQFSRLHEPRSHLNPLPLSVHTCRPSPHQPIPSVSISTRDEIFPRPFGSVLAPIIDSSTVRAHRLHFLQLVGSPPAVRLESRSFESLHLSNHFFPTLPLDIITSTRPIYRHPLEYPITVHCIYQHPTSSPP